MDTEKSFQKIYNRIIVYVIGIPVAFLIIFIVVSVNQLREINSRMYEGQSQAVKEMMTKFVYDRIHNEQFQQFMILATLEEESLTERYNQGHFSLASRSFKQFLGFFTGIIMVIVGSVFIILRLKEKVNLDAGQGESWKVSLITSSPGVAFGVVGAILISIASLSKDTITISDSGLYLTKEYLVAPFFSAEGSRSALEGYLIGQGNEGSANVKEQHPPKGETTNGDKTLKEKTNKQEGTADEELMITRPPTKK